MIAGRPVKFARLSIPQAVHPSLLYAISVAPRASVANSLAAKAITSAAFRRIAPWYALDFVVSLCRFFILTQMACLVRDYDDEVVDLITPKLPGAVCRICLALLGAKVFVGELILLKCYRRPAGWEYSGWWKFFVCLLDVLLVAFPDHLNEQWLRVLLSVEMLAAVLRAMTFLCALETARVGLHILPVVESFKGSISILLVIAFALVGSTSIFWGLSNRSAFSVFRSMFRLGLLSDFDVKEDVFGGIAESFGWEYIAFVFATFLISVSLMNIFIGVMTSMYDYFQSRAVELFVRRRSCTSMHYMLQVQECQKLLRRMCPGKDARPPRRRRNCMSIDFRSPAQIAWIGAEPPWRRLRPRSARWGRGSSTHPRKSARTSKSWCSCFCLSSLQAHASTVVLLQGRGAV
ncbi:unnamed protein product [Prorocentrum cordatum]|uniref:Ion transport domain-containing protein n=1 Tax=Prorocentrum cordatum TaxID=2364126 RepID=A0ABN9Q044_9DINO|nr:unnamed protein product [Polarella glacialis]